MSNVDEYEQAVYDCDGDGLMMTAKVMHKEVLVMATMCFSSYRTMFSTPVSMLSTTAMLMLVMLTARGQCPDLPGA